LIGAAPFGAGSIACASAPNEELLIAARALQGSVFLALGPLIGGGIVELAGWRWIFLINVVPITAIIAIALRWFPEAKATVKKPLDKKGLALLVVGSCAWCSRC